MRAWFAILTAVNPLAVAAEIGPPKRTVVLAVAAILTWALAFVGAVASRPVLDALDVTPETFRIAAGIVLVIVGVRWVAISAGRVADGGAEGWGQLLVPYLVPVLVTPHLAMVSISTGADEGVIVVTAAAGVSLALALAAAAVRARTVVVDAGVRMVGAIAVAVALALIVDGVRAV